MLQNTEEGECYSTSMDKYGVSDSIFLKKQEDADYDDIKLFNVIDIEKVVAFKNLKQCLFHITNNKPNCIDDKPAQFKFDRCIINIWVKDGVIHRSNGPSIVVFTHNGIIKIESYYINGKNHREDGPAYIEYYENGNIKIESYYIHGKKHRENGPSRIEYYENGNIKSKFYYIDDKKHKEDGPAYIEYYKNRKMKKEIYYIDDKKHKEDGPALIDYNRNGKIITKTHYINGQLKDKSTCVVS